jgi:hypothetical protein
MADNNEFNSLEDRVEALEKEIAKYKGFIGGILFLGSCAVTVITLVLDYFKK